MIPAKKIHELTEAEIALLNKVPTAVKLLPSQIRPYLENSVRVGGFLAVDFRHHLGDIRSYMGQLSEVDMNSVQLGVGVQKDMVRPCLWITDVNKGGNHKIYLDHILRIRHNGMILDVTKEPA